MAAYTPANFGRVQLRARTLLRAARPGYSRDERIQESKDELETWLAANYDNPYAELSDVAYEAVELAAKEVWKR